MRPQDETHFTPRSYRISHVTRYTYDGDVTGCYERGPLRPRETAQQTVESHELGAGRPRPRPGAGAHRPLRQPQPLRGIRTPHTGAHRAPSATVVTCTDPPRLAALDDGDGRTAAPAVVTRRRTGRARGVPAAVAAGRTQWTRRAEYAAPMLTADRPLGQALAALYGAIHRDFTYPRARHRCRTTLRQGSRAAGRGLPGLRSPGRRLPSRGRAACALRQRLPRDHPAGRPGASRGRTRRTRGPRCWSRRAWVDLDPTNDHLVDSRYVITAGAGTSRDVSPLKGVMFTESTTSRLEVAVDVQRIADGLPL